MKILEIIFGKPKQKTVYTPIDAERIKDNEIIKKQQQKIVAQEVQLSRQKAIDKQKEEREKEKDKESERNKKLKEQEKDLKANIHGKTIKLGKFYQKLFTDKAFREKLEIVDKYDEVVLGKFGDFVLMEGG
jgi:Skp family chaperone for outer membrane proteins